MMRISLQLHRLWRRLPAVVAVCAGLSAWWLPPVSARETPAHAVALMYHRFGEAAHPATSITLAQFEAQLAYLADEGFRVWPLTRILRRLREGGEMPDRVVAITIDDAYRSVYEQAFPRLRERGWPFTVFVSTDAVDERLPDYMSWEQLREMQRAGVEFANHSTSHGHLWLREAGEERSAWAQRVRRDIERAQTRLQQELGTDTNTAPALFAYPYGEFDARLAALVRELGYVGIGQHSGAVGAMSDYTALPRYPMAEAFADREAFARKALSLPLPVSEAQPGDPLVREQNPPVLELTLAPGGYVADGFDCYASGQGRAEVQRLEDRPPRYRVRAREPLPMGRARYNCTAPAAGSGRWYWYSQPWIIAPGVIDPDG
ncbi:polysaccharide deacetylase family protein [Thiohalobacter thiocyanaticus]|uniref:NodB homology domain-containing protein n=1 Tax=Thiohalobacter thiocyanaticus TaxID=585455 RepID=A0A426QGZ4_9GAMM|nr:polysaccharide deacetylase family protein [Thiohalobacter thiocyanaticus]RRQ21022.1 hypothetical protein D6C00_02930 [Thiohalobacter thiocyanaticus]